MFLNKGRSLLFIVVASFFLLLSGCSRYTVYSVKDNPLLPVSGGVTYALPRTQLCVAVTVARRDLSNAPYREFAADYLGTDDMDSSFHIVGMDVYGVNVADPDYFYYVKIRRGSVSVDERQLLLAVGMPPVVSGNDSYNVQPTNGSVSSANGVRATYNLYDRSDTFYTRYDTPGHPSLVSSKKDVRNTKQRAAAAAEQIEELQERQRQLLGGTYEGTYSLESIQFIMQQLRQMEAQAVAEFCGELRRETILLYVDPGNRRKDGIDTVAWFSPSQGLLQVDASAFPDDAYPIVCAVSCGNEMRVVDRFMRYHTSGTSVSHGEGGRSASAAARKRNRKTFRYRLPATASVTVSTQEFAVSRQLQISQFGPVVEIPRNKVKALFDPQTLNLIYLGRGND